MTLMRTINNCQERATTKLSPVKRGIKMLQRNRLVIVVMVFITVASFVTWVGTGGDWYTKFEVVEQVETQLDPNDPLVAAGFYDDETTFVTETRDEFRFGLLPTPSGIFDKHAVSFASVTGPTWFLGLGFIWFQRRRHN